MVGPVDLEVHAGEALTITGPSGSGKSTLLRCLAILEARAQGSLHFLDVQVASAAVPAFRRQVIYVAQTPPRFAGSVLESLQMAFGFASSTQAFSKERAAAMCEELLLPPDILGRSLARVSGGEAQRLGIVRALLLDPRVLLLDEPTSALDLDAEAAVHHMIETWFAKGDRATVSISHKRELLASVGTRRMHMLQGRLGEAA